MYEFIHVEEQGRVQILTLNRPDRYNAWHSPMRNEIVRHLQATAARADLGALVITGAGESAFCAGQDLAEARDFDGARAELWVEEWKELYGSLRRVEIPVVIALNGLAAGSGFQFALLGDIRVGHPGAALGQPEIDSGLPSPLGLWLIWEMVGWSRTVELVLTGRMMEAEECRQLGLIHHLVPPEQVIPTALTVARELADKPPLAMRLNKRRIREATEAGFMEAENAGRPIHREAYASGEPRMAMERFFAERSRRRSQSE